MSRHFYKLSGEVGGEGWIVGDGEMGVVTSLPFLNCPFPTTYYGLQY